MRRENSVTIRLSQVPQTVLSPISLSSPALGCSPLGTAAPAEVLHKHKSHRELGCELQVMQRAKAPWPRGVWQCHRRYGSAPHLIQQLGPKLQEPEGQGTRLQTLAGGCICSSREPPELNWESNHQTALWAAKERSPSLFKALK